MIVVLAVLLFSATVQAELKLVANFDKIAAGPDGQACDGVLGGVIDTETDNTGNSHYGTTGGSVGISIQGNSGGSLRAIGIGGINSPITAGGSGLVFCRFMIRASGAAVRHHIGVFANATTDPINSTTAGDPKTCPVGIKMIPNGTASFDVVTLDGATVLKTALARGTWYNLFMSVDYGSNVFTLYMSAATAPGTPVTLPVDADLVKANIPFTATSTDPLNCLVYSAEAGTGQADYIYMDDVWWDGNQGIGAVKRAASPSPADKATDVARDVVLSWKPLPFAATNNVYLGTSFADVDGAKTTVQVSTGSDANTYDSPGVLVYGQTYYWKVDEVNTIDKKVFAGSVWSFTVEPATYPLSIKNIAASASGSSANMGPEKTIDGSGLDVNDTHGTLDTTMWLSDDVIKPAWIQYAFDDLYKLEEMWVWNSNQSIESIAGLGAKDVTVQCSVDGVTWTTLAGVPPFARAPGAAGYAHNTTVNFGGVAARYVKLTINSNWGGITSKVGLSEVRFFYKPVLATNPQPTTAKTGVTPDVVLGWRTGHEAASHQVYFGTDGNNLTLAGTTTQASFTPAVVNLGTTYYWRVDEVNTAENPSLWKGKVWSFSTSEYSTIDDMESYNDTDNPIFDTWVDGFGTTTNGALVAWDNSGTTGTFGERTVVHSGKQSMPFRYTNTGSIATAEGERTWSTAQDWTANGANTLSLWYRGNPIGFAAIASDHILMNGTGTDIYNAADQGRFVYKQLSGNGSIIARVDRLDNTNAWAKAGVMIRETLDAGSTWAYSLASISNGVHFQARLTAGVNATSDTVLTTLPTSQTTAPIPMWVKIERVGNVFNAYYSTDGVAWTPNPWNPQTITMQTNVYIGLAVTSHQAGAVTQAEFSAITTTGNVTGNWQSADLGITQPAGNTLDTFYVTVKDNAGKSITIKNTDGLAVTAGAWVQWKIPFSSLTGISVNRVKGMVIGVGDKTAPKHGVGTLYIDDIAAGHPVQ
jgi:hypothetical protein